MDSEQIKKAKEVLNDAEKNYQILWDARGFLSVNEQFDLSQSISTHITSNESLLKYCEENEEYSSKREKLLKKIQNLQKDLIDSISTERDKVNLDESYNVKNYKEASGALGKIAQEELTNGFISNKNDRILSSILECDVHPLTLKDVIERLNGEIYNILIMGGYQSGKTTLINAIIGQYVGTIGNGSPTSAVPIAYTYGSEEQIKVIWRSKARLMEVLSILSPYIADANLDSFDLENENARTDLLNKLNIFRQTDRCPKSHEAGCKALAICSLILRYYGTHEWSKAITMGYSYNDIAVLTRFPKNDEHDFQVYWKKKGESIFDLRTSLFAFIERIECTINSSRLKELNCTIIDAPGLFSNEYDTQVAQIEMERADAILYLLPYDKQIGEENCSSLFTIKKKNEIYGSIARKLFVVNNITQADRRKNFVNANRSIINDMFDSNTKFLVLDVHLAWLGIVNEIYERGMLSEPFKKEFIRTCQGEGYDKQIDANDFEEEMRRQLWPYCLPKDISVDEIITRSNLIKVLEDLINFIKQNKAYSIIVSNGIGKMYNEVSSIRKSMYLQRIEPFIVGHDKIVDLWETRLKRVDEFSKNVKTIFHEHFYETTPSPYERLTSLVNSRMFDDEAIKELANKITSAIYNNKWQVAKIGKNDEKIKEFLKPIVENVVLEFISSKIYSWNTLIKLGQDVPFSHSFEAELSLLKVKLETKWSSLFSDDPGFKGSNVMSTYLEIPSSTQSFAMREQNEGVSQNISIKQKDLAKYLLSDLMTTITAIIGAITMFAIPTILLIVSNPVGWFTGLTLGAGAAIYGAIEGEDAIQKNFVCKIAPKVLEKLKESNIQSSLGCIVRKEMENILNGYISNLTVNKRLIENNATIATSTPNTKLAEDCSLALSITEKIDRQLGIYKEFISSHLKK